MREAGMDLPRVITSFSELLNIETYPWEEKKVFKETAMDEVKLQQRTTFASFSEMSSAIRFIYDWFVNRNRYEYNRIRSLTMRLYLLKSTIICMYVNYTNNNNNNKVGNSKWSIPFQTSPNSEVVNTKVCQLFQIQNSNSVYSIASYQNSAMRGRREKA